MVLPQDVCSTLPHPSTSATTTAGGAAATSSVAPPTSTSAVNVGVAGVIVGGANNTSPMRRSKCDLSDDDNDDFSASDSEICVDHNQDWFKVCFLTFLFIVL